MKVQQAQRGNPTIKVVSAVTKVVDAGTGRVHAIVSTEDKDRDGDIIRQEFWNLDHFNNHPVLLSSHNYRDIRAQIGEWEDMEVKAKRLEGVAKYYIGEGNPDADWAYNLASKGKAAYSVGFQPDFEKAVPLGDEETCFPNFEFRGQELLEVSHVTIPSNRQALQSAKTFSLHPAVADVIDHFLLGAGMEEKSAHGSHDHDEKGDHEHDDYKALMLRIDSELMRIEEAFEIKGGFDWETLHDTVFDAMIAAMNISKGPGGELIIAPPEKPLVLMSPEERKEALRKAIKEAVEEGLA